MGGYWRAHAVCVTGAAQGLGRALALELARSGCAALALADRAEAELGAVARACAAAGCARVSVLAGDVAAAGAGPALAAAVLGAHGRCSVLVNCAGVLAVGPFEATPAGEFERVMEVNFAAIVRLTRAFLPLLRRERKSHLVNVSSMYSFFTSENAASYHCSKAALRAFSEALLCELRDSSVLVHSVHPGFIKTNLARNSSAPSAEVKEETARLFDMVARTSPESAARTILGAVERGQWRVLVGPDSFLLDWLTRAAPSPYLSPAPLRATLLAVVAAQALAAGALRDTLGVEDWAALALSVCAQVALVRGIRSRL